MSRTWWQAIGAVAFALAVVAGTVTVTRAAMTSSPPAQAPAASDEGGPGVPGGPRGDSADAGFARDMAAHHQQAVEMSFLVRDRTKDADVRRLAYDIANTQANQRGMMLGWLDLWGLPKTGIAPMAWMGGSGPSGHSGHAQGPEGLMPGMATRAQLADLGKASGRDAEVRYLRLMTAHHKGGVEMARGCVRLCTVKVEKELAQGMVDAQQAEVELMEGMLRERGQ
ncbi:DUF305 domain-containing protein [Streptomyces spiroverticillatus]|uniref:DUF305 domain-containing protein n=1 Tax=Streptomyces finlayi TaxID=67296 RepID=A0A918X2X1_9ACTN|nr:DUF305 domain-containing protein [Streptomyces finlayi]GGZ94189.1 DUF305 domain-containing protein [Streptomyces spiroverticillatus]GHD06622.1 DUF305 domain-containing protein [Streptomyces finlayi]